MSNDRTFHRSSFLYVFIPLNYILAAAVAHLVCVTGGGPSVYANIIMVPVMLTAITTPLIHSVFFATLSGLLLGPIMDYIISGHVTGLSWLVRMGIYILLASVVAWISSKTRKNERHFEYIATHDPLTDLKNFSCIAESEIPSNGALSIMMLTFNEDGDIRGLFGGDFYQNTVKRIAEELTELLKPYPNAVLFKGADLNFAITVKHFSSEESLENILAALQNLNGVLLTVDKITIYISFRIGFTVVRQKENLSEGMRHATIALRYSYLKEQDISRYNDAMLEYYRGTVSIASEFSSAIEKGLVQASYQTIHDAETHEAVGVEIFAKWIRDDGSRMTAEEFVPILAKTSCLHKLTMFMTEEALRYASLPANASNRFSVNYSASNLSEKSVLEFVRTIELSGIDPDRIMIEITGDSTEDISSIRENLKFIHKHNIHIAFDYLSPLFSAIAIQGDIPIDVIKIGRRITSHVGQERGLAMVRSIASFAHANGIRTVAEGIENIMEARACTEAGVDCLQGYFFSVPTLMRDAQAASFAKEEKANAKTDSSSSARSIIHEVNSSSQDE